VVTALVFLVGLFSGGDSSQQRAKVALAPPASAGAGRQAHKKAHKTKTAGPRHDRSQRAKEQAAGDSRSSSGASSGSAAQPGDAGGGEPVVASRPKPTPSPRPRPAPAPSQVTVSSQSGAPEPVEPVSVANNNTGP
jgi:hypothetical protein